MEQKDNIIDFSRKKHFFDGRILEHKIFENFHFIPISDDEKNKIANEFIQILIKYKMKEKNIDIVRCINRLKKIDFYMDNSICRCYYPNTDSVEIPSYISHESLHELIHGMTGPSYFKKHYLKWEMCLVEGMTESTVRRIRSNPDEGQAVLFNGLRFDIPESNNEYMSYTHYVAIVRQMETILGYNADSYIINGDNKFMDDFKKKYGSLFLIKLGYKLSRYRCDIEEIQNSLLTRCFEIDLLNAKNENDIKELITKLRNIYQLRGKKQDGTDEFYDNFYHETYNKCMKYLNDNSMNVSFMKEYEDAPKNSIFYPSYSISEMLNVTLNDFKKLVMMSDNMDFNQIIDDISNMKIKYKKNKLSNYDFYIMINGKILMSRNFTCNTGISLLNPNIDISEDECLVDIDLTEYEDVIEDFISNNDKKAKSM